MQGGVGKKYTIFLRSGKRGGWFEVIAFGWFLNPKFEIRNPKQIRMLKIQMFQTSNGEIEVETCYGVFETFEHLILVLVSLRWYRYLHKSVLLK